MIIRTTKNHNLPYADPQSRIIVNKYQGFWLGFYKSVKLENNDAMVCKRPRIFWRQYVGYIDTVRHARDYKVKYSSMLLPRVGFLLSCACQEVVWKGFNKGWFVNTRCAVNGVPEDVWQIKVTRNCYIVELVMLVTNFMQKVIEYIHPTWVFIGWPIAKAE